MSWPDDFSLKTSYLKTFVKIVIFDVVKSKVTVAHYRLNSKPFRISNILKFHFQNELKI